MKNKKQKKQKVKKVKYYFPQYVVVAGSLEEAKIKTKNKLNKIKDKGI